MKALCFKGSGSEYFKIWIVNILLIIVTLGLYYPWAKVRNHRYFYANTILEERNFEYHATGKQLFLGFLVAMVLFITYIVISKILPIGGFMIMGILFVAIPWLIWRSLKFSLKMTSFSNVRFGFKGTLRQAYINFFVFPFLFILALYGVPMGVAVGVPMMLGEEGVAPWLQAILPLAIIISIGFAFYLYGFMKKKNTSYRLNGTRYGQGIFETNLEVKKFLFILLKTIGMSILVIGVFVLLIGSVVYTTIGLEGVLEMKYNMNNPQAGHTGLGLMMMIYISAYLGFIFSSMLIMAYSITRQRSYIYQNTSLDKKISFASTLKAKSLAWVMVTNFIVILLTLGLAFPWTKVRMARLIVENTLVDTEAGFYEYITQKEKEESSLGEQIGDAFDVDVGIGL